MKSVKRLLFRWIALPALRLYFGRTANEMRKLAEAHDESVAHYDRLGKLTSAQASLRSIHAGKAKGYRSCLTILQQELDRAAQEGA